MVCFLPQQTQALLGPLSWTQNNHHLCWSQHAPPWYFTLRYTHLYRRGTCGPCKKRTQEAGPQYLPRSVGWKYGITWSLGVGTTSNSKSVTVNVLKSKYECIYSICLHNVYIYIYTITLAIFICGFHAVLTQALPRQVHWHQNPQKRWSFHWMTRHQKIQPFPPTSTCSSDLPVWKGEGWKVTSPQKAHRASPVGFSTAQEPWHQKKSEDPLISGSTMTEEKKTQKYC